MLAELREHVLSKLCSVTITVLNTLKVDHCKVTSQHTIRTVARVAALHMQVKPLLYGRKCYADCLPLTPRSRLEGYRHLRKEQQDY